MRKTIIVLLTLLSLIFVPSLRADELTDLEDQLQNTRNEIQETQSKLDSAQSALQEAEAQETYYAGLVGTLSGQLSYAQWQLEQTFLEIEAKQLELQQTESHIQEAQLNEAYQRKLLTKMVRGFYIDTFTDDLSIFLTDTTQGALAQVLAYRQEVAESYRHRLLGIIEMLSELTSDKQNLETVKTELENAKVELESQKVSLQYQINSAQNQISSAQSQQEELASSLTGIEGELSQLTGKEQEILRAKAAAALASTTVGNEEITKAAIESDPPADGNTYFSFWTYGYPHQVGMNQYGAYGRSKAGQSAHQILGAYYTNVAVVTRDDLPETITIQTGSGTSEISFEDDYLKGIGEMPSCWGTSENGGFEALKAQVIAARSYALSYTNMGSVPICTTQACQVYVGSSKITGTCGEYWEQAVDDTHGQVVMHNGQVIAAWYASTAGGFTRSSEEVWGSYRAYALGIADLDELSFPYDGPQWGNSPWYHKAWGNEAWLSGGQVADLFNAALLPDEYNDHLPSEQNGGFSEDEVRSTLQSHGITPVDIVTAVEVFGQTSRTTTLIRVYYGDGQSKEIDGQRFRFVFNLRSPGTNAIWTPRFDVVTSS